MPDAIAELLYQLPVAGLMLLVVWRFLAFIKERDKNWLDTIRSRDADFIGEISDHQEKISAQTHETTQVLRQNAVVLSEVAKVLEKVDGKLNIDAFEREQERRRRG